MARQADGSLGPERKPKPIFDPANHKLTKQFNVKDCIEAAELLEIVYVLIELGHALSISRTRDGGALSLTFMVDGQKVRRYPSTREAWQEVLAEVLD